MFGIGEKAKASQENFRRAYGLLARYCHKHKITSLNLLLPKAEGYFRGIIEGLTLANYSFDAHKSVKKKNSLIESVFLLDASIVQLKYAKQIDTIIESVFFVRDLVNTSADIVTPKKLAECARKLAKDNKSIKTTVLSSKEIKKEKMGLLIAVGRGSKEGAKLIVVHYNGNPKVKKQTALIGKAVTYDTGGLSLKSPSSMLKMRSDMAGGAAVLGVIKAIAELGLKVNVTAVVPAVENCISHLSFKPGDVYTAMNGQTVHIGSTDAEGRLILADAMTYTKKYIKPNEIIDVATLTGAIITTFGHLVTGLMSNDKDITERLHKAGEETFERVWELPIYDEYRSLIDSDIADISNTGKYGASSISSAKFIQEFVENIPWAHLDIAGTSFLPIETDYLPKNATGGGVRLLVEYLQHR